MKDRLALAEEIEAALQAGEKILDTFDKQAKKFADSTNQVLVATMGISVGAATGAGIALALKAATVFILSGGVVGVALVAPAFVLIYRHRTRNTIGARIERLQVRLQEFTKRAIMLKGHVPDKVLDGLWETIRESQGRLTTLVMADAGGRREPHTHDMSGQLSSGEARPALPASPSTSALNPIEQTAALESVKVPSR